MEFIIVLMVLGLAALAFFHFRNKKSETSEQPQKDLVDSNPMDFEPVVKDPVDSNLVDFLPVEKSSVDSKPMSSVSSSPKKATAKKGATKAKTPATKRPSKKVKIQVLK